MIELSLCPMKIVVITDFLRRDLIKIVKGERND
ncbi:MAG: hypothetical protein PWR19_1498 [Carnobacterium sp.]|nr:hypothetical protein [Carnobacterium sp.]